MPSLNSLNKRKRSKIGQQKESLPELVMNGYMYTEIHRAREQITKGIQENTSRSIMFSSPDDNSGTTLFVSLLGINLAVFTQMKILLVDFNMRYPYLHEAFELENSNGFTEFAKGETSLKNVVKKTPFSRLRCISAGDIGSDISLDTNRSILENFIGTLKAYFDIIIFDTSPLLTQNRNNIDPSLLSLVCDNCFIVVRDRMTTRTELQRAIEIIPEKTEKLNGIIYNLQQ